MTPKRVAKAKRKGIRRMEPRFQRARDAITASPADILPDPLHGSPYPRSPELENGDRSCRLLGRSWLCCAREARAAYCLYTVGSMWFDDLCQCNICVNACTVSFIKPRRKQDPGIRCRSFSCKGEEKRRGQPTKLPRIFW